jgi:hypothetical protein
VKVLHTWYECYRHSCTAGDCGTLAISFSRIVRDALGIPLSLACALCFSLHIPEDESFCRKERSFKLVLVGCHTRPFLLDDVPGKIRTRSEDAACSLVAAVVDMSL